MQENTNKAIFINSAILYAKLIVTAVAGLLTTRFALQALGADDFGIFSVVGSVISFVAIVNTIMISTSNRFMATAIGKGDEKLIKDTFNVNVVMHVVIAVVILLVAYPLGDWFILNHIKYEGDINSVLSVYHITIIGSIISFIGVPYNGLLIAKERFLVFSSTDILASVIKVVVSYLLIDHFNDKLSVYALTICITTAFPSFVFIAYCRKLFPKIVALHMVKKWQPYKEVLSFSVWVGYGAIATVGKSQGAALVVNVFFNTIMNTALGLANSVNSILLMFSNNVTKSVAPQIVKNYSAGNLKRCEELVVLSSKITFFIMLLVSSPFLIAPEFILNLWLGSVPEYVIVFTNLVIIDALIGTLNAGIPELVFATGKIKNYQLILNTIFLLSVVTAYYVLKCGTPAYFLMLTYIIFSIIALIIRQIVLNRVVKFNNKRLFVESYLPCLLIVCLFVPFLYFAGIFHPVIAVLAGLLYLLVLITILGTTKKEKNMIVLKIKELKRSRK